MTASTTPLKKWPDFTEFKEAGSLIEGKAIKIDLTDWISRLRNEASLA